MRIKVTLAYDGSSFNGWGIQPNAPTVQGILEEALSTITGRLVRTTVAGRTDTGVHANGQVAHFDLEESEWQKFVCNYTDTSEAFIRRIAGLVNLILSKRIGRFAKGAIEIKAAEVVSEDFDARFAALWRRYSYTIEDKQFGWNPLNRNHVMHYRGQLDVSKMNIAAEMLLGKHDFIAFCKPRVGATTTRVLEEFFWERHGDELVTAHLKADAFCHHMVRSLVGATLMVGSGEREPKWLYERLKKQERNPEANIAPGHALVLEEIAYPDENQWAQRATLTRAKREK
ncbi:MAG: tRNA pseudouridine(38-40) synthase TruA [Micrococcaceae bacterium]